MPLLSVIVITKNEAHNIEGCLKSVAWVDEIVVVDSGSTDRTVEICKQYTDKILVTDWPGYGAQKQRALAMATGEWVLSIDADERVTPTLKEEVLTTISNTDYDGFEISFNCLTYFSYISICALSVRFESFSVLKSNVFLCATKASFNCNDALILVSIIVLSSFIIFLKFIR